MFPILDHIDTLIAADFYEENNQPFLSEAMKLLNRPCLEIWGGEYRYSISESISGCKAESWSISKAGYNRRSRSNSKSGSAPWAFTKSKIKTIAWSMSHTALA